MLAALFARRRRMRALATARASSLALVGATLAAVTPLAGCDAPEGTVAAPAAPRGIGGESRLASIFTDAAAQTGVPAELLAAVAYTETRLRFVGRYAPEAGKHDDHGNTAIGLFGLTEGGPRDIVAAAQGAGLSAADVHTDELANTLAAAWLLAQPGSPTALDAYYGALVTFGGGAGAGDAFARDVLALLGKGFVGRDDAGATLTVSARPVSPATGYGTVEQSLGYPGAIWRPANSGNYANGSRTAADITHIVIHTTQGSYNGAISWFQNADSNVSSHYILKSTNGEVTQMVDDADVAWHDACFNSNSIGIEHEGFVDDPELWYTEAMYGESAKLTAWLADAYGVPKTRAFIQGHGETDDCSSHTDPGSGWDWDHYMDLVVTGGVPQLDAGAGATAEIMTLRPGERAVVWVEYDNRGNTTWDINDTRLGTAEPNDRASAFFVDGNWLSPNRASGPDHSDYGPGSTGRFTFMIQAPAVETTTTFNEAFQLVQEGTGWFGPVINLAITVQADGEPVDPVDPEDPTDPTAKSGGCAAGGGGTGLAFGLLAVVGLMARRRRASR